MYILFDIGATNMRVSATVDKERFVEPRIVFTPQDFDEGIQIFSQLARELSGGEKIKAVVGGIVGPFDKEKRCLVNTPNLLQWNNRPFRSALEETLGASVYMENDTDMVGLGEAMFGAGKGCDVVTYMTVSTGVGGARIVRGKIDSYGFGTEPGDQIIDPRGELAPSGSLEDYISGTAVEKRFHKKPKEIQDPKVWDELAQWLAYGLHNTIVHWSPDVVVVGGSMITKPPCISLELTSQYVGKLLKIFPIAPPIVKATLGDIGGLYGSLHYLKHLNI